MTSDSVSHPDSLARYSRQVRFDPLGESGQKRLSESMAVVMGCGALGSVIAERLVRSGVGKIRLVDRDWVELSNLQRQAIYTERDAELATPKSVAAAQGLAQINSQVEIEPIVDDITFANIQGLVEGADVILDGTDNFETRFLINDCAVKFQIPWVHGGCLGASGQVMTIIPGQTACFRCLLPELPPREAMETCDTAGVLGPAVGLIGCWQAAEALKILSGNSDKAAQGLIVLDSWQTESRVVSLSQAKDCPTCVRLETPFLDGQIRSDAAILCGKNAVQIQGPKWPATGLQSLAERLAQLGEVTRNAYFLRVRMAEYTLTVFASGRTVVEGTTEISEAKSVISRTLGA